MGKITIDLSYFSQRCLSEQKNWTNDEEQLLVRLCKEKHQVLFGNFNSGQTHQQKKREWVKIADSVSSKTLTLSCII